MSSRQTFIALGLVGVLAAPLASATTIVETFDTDTTDLAGAYADFTLSGGSAQVTGGALQFDVTTADLLQRYTRSHGFADDFWVSADVRGSTFGNWNLGVELGNRRFIFHPEFNGTGGPGAFRIEDAATLGAFTVNQDMGFVPDGDTFHTMLLEWVSASSLVRITISDGEGIAAPYVFEWTADAGFDPTQSIGFTMKSPASQFGFGPARFDNLIISDTTLPEPASALLLVLGLAGLAARGTRSGAAARH